MENADPPYLCGYCDMPINVDEVDHHPCLNRFQEHAIQDGRIYGVGVQPSNEHLDDEASTSSTWSEASTKLLIAYYSELQPKVGKCAKLKTKTKMWKLIGEKMRIEGYDFSDIQIQNRAKTLFRGYKEVHDNNKKTGRARASCSYQTELDDLLAHKKNVNPEFLLGSEEPITAAGVSGEREKKEEMKKKEPNMKAEILKLEREKLEETKKRNEQLSRRNDLLEELISIIKK